MHVVVATHGHCFDGLASATLFTRLIREIGSPNARFSYRACGYGAGQQSASHEVLEGDDNVILDYRFVASPRLTWYFDHHRTAFVAPSDRDFFEARVPTGRFYHDPDYPSCAGLVARVAREQFGVALDDLSELVRWANTVDSASFSSAAAALDHSQPVLRFAAVVEHYGDNAFLARTVPDLLERGLDAVAQSKDVERRFKPLRERHERSAQRIRDKGQRLGRVVFVDLTDAVIENVAKFVTYLAYPEATYSVVVALLKNGAKISVGYNPWSGHPLDKDISQICSRYGGGGHSAVGAIPFQVTQLDQARSIARAVAAELAQ